MKNIKLTFESTGSNKTKGKLVAKQNGEILHTDVIDIAKDKDRTAFIKELEKLSSDLDTDQVRQWMLTEVEHVSKKESTSSPQQETELDNSRMVRPHLFHTSEVSGLLVPVTRLSGDVPRGNWQLCVQWTDGKRESLNLERYLTLPNDERLWFNPIPGYPDTNNNSGWSAQGRQKWLGGYAPEPKKLYTRLTECFDYFLEFPEEEKEGHLATLSLWTILTYAYPVWSAVPYLSFGGPVGSGKTTVFNVLNKIVCRPLRSSNMTAPCLFRMLDAQGGILLLDEAERLRDRAPDSKEIMSILLAGYTRGSKAHRLEKVKDTWQSASFDVYGPKAIAAVNELPPALASRCIRIVMFRASKDSEKTRHRINDKIQSFREIADDLHAFALDNGPEFIKLAQDMTVCEGMFGRDMEVWQPILALAKLIEGHGVTGLSGLLKRHAEQAIEKVNDDTVPETDEIVLRVVADSFFSDDGKLTASQILTTARIKDDTLFKFYRARGIGAILKRYGITSNRKGGKRIFMTKLEQLRKIQERYGLELNLERNVRF